ncbi:MAG: type II secretion system protein [Bacillota bacterium]
MKKMVKNQKGFSLIELLIVIAIMGVLAAIAFGMFSGVLGNAKKRADEQNAKVIERAVLAYLVDSQDWNLAKSYYNVNGTTGQIQTGDSWREIIQALQGQLQDASSNPTKEFGPYLSPKGASSPGSAQAISDFAPQWSGSVGQYTGYKIDIYPSNQQVIVVPHRTTTTIAIN